MRLDVVIHHLRVCRRNHDLSFFTVSLYIPGDPCGFQSLQDILILCFRRGENGGIIHVHVGFGNIRDGDQPFQYILLRYGGEGNHMAVPHNLVRLL